ncbi:hypothetical protein NMG60_11006760 [Bertholletia excelsa]
MEAHEGDNNSAVKSLVEEPVIGFQSTGLINHNSPSTPNSDDFSEEALSHKFENVGLRSSEVENGNIDGDQSDPGGRDISKLHPLRPHAEDCPYYLRTGTCKFGLNCRYNHPVRRTNQVGKEKEKEKDNSTADEGFSEKSYHIECKYYLTAEGCKYGTSCRYKHLKDEYDIAPPQLNFLGLPIRLGEKECPFYMQNGSCGYGDRCKFHHPDPTSVGIYESLNSTPNNESIGRFGLPLGNYNGKPVKLCEPEALQPVQASSSLQMLSDQNVPCQQDNYSSFTPAMQIFPQGALQAHGWNRFQAANSAEERIRHPYLAPAARSLVKKEDISNQFEDFPERPGQPACVYFTKTGNCKFRSACRYHHPKSQKSDCLLNDKGLPLRPGRKICRNYAQFGICKYGCACFFDHPVTQFLDFSNGSLSET